MVIVSSDPIDPSRAYGSIAKLGAGSVVFHYAVVKENAGDRPTACIDYQADDGTEGELTGIAADLREKWRLEDVFLVRRTGCLEVGEIISLVAASSPNSADAFQACQQGIERLKRMATIRKQEVFR